MNIATLVFIETIILFILWILIPLIPAVLIYKLFPDTKVFVEGVLEDLTLNTSGSFAAYLLIILLSKSFVFDLKNTIEGSLKPTWIIEAPLLITDHNGDDISSFIKKENLEVSLNPDFYEINDSGSNKKLSFKVSGVNANSWPSVIFTVRDINGDIFGGMNLNLSQEHRYIEYDYNNKVAKLRKPVHIKKIITGGIGL